MCLWLHLCRVDMFRTWLELKTHKSAMCVIGIWVSIWVQLGEKKDIQIVQNHPEGGRWSGVLYSLRLACGSRLNFTKRGQIKRLKCKLFPHLAALRSMLTMQISAMSACVQNKERLFVLKSTSCTCVCVFRGNSYHFTLFNFTLIVPIEDRKVHVLHLEKNESRECWRLFTENWN